MKRPLNRPQTGTMAQIVNDFGAGVGGSCNPLPNSGADPMKHGTLQ